MPYVLEVYWIHSKGAFAMEKENSLIPSLCPRIKIPLKLTLYNKCLKPSSLSPHQYKAFTNQFTQVSFLKWTPHSNHNGWINNNTVQI